MKVIIDDALKAKVDNALIVSDEVKAEIVNRLNDLKSLLKDNLELYYTLVRKSLLLGKEGEDGYRISSSIINKLIDEAYPILDTTTWELYKSVKLAAYHLGKLICCESPIIKNQFKIDFPNLNIVEGREWDFVMLFREKIEKEIIKNIFPNELTPDIPLSDMIYEDLFIEEYEEDIDIIGKLEPTFENLNM